MRLIGDDSTLSGRVEVCVDDSWNTVCDMSWSNADTTVFCRQLGHSANGEEHRNSICIQRPAVLNLVANHLQDQTSCMAACNRETWCPDCTMQ